MAIGQASGEGGGDAKGGKPRGGGKTNNRSDDTHERPQNLSLIRR
jgi:hypothetical protein